MKSLRHVVICCLLLSLSSCYLPASKNWYGYAGNFCGRDTLTERFCSLGFSVVTLPIQLGALVLDIPFGIIEFFVGWAPFEQPLLETSELDGGVPLPFVDARGNVWKIISDPTNVDRLLLTRSRDDVVISSYWVTRLDGRNVKLANAICEDYSDVDSCLDGAS